MPLSKKQLELIKIKNAKENIIVIDGGVRSGKTHFSSTIGFFELILHQQINNPLLEGNQYLVLGTPSAKNAYINVTSRIVEYAKQRGFSVRKIRPQNYDYEFTRNDIKFTIDTYACSTEFSWQQYQGRTIRSVFIDEASIIDRKNIEVAMDRTLSFTDAKTIMTSNPMGSTNHWFYQTYIQDHESKNIKYFHLTLMDNPIIPNDRIEQYRRIFTPNMFAQRVMGQWVLDEGAIYQVLPEQSRTEELSHIYFGMDYGESDATSVVAVGVTSDMNYYILDQYYHSNRTSMDKKNILNYQDEIVNFINDTINHWDVQAIMYCETSPQSMYNLLRRDGRIDRRIAIKSVNKSKVNYKSKTAIQERIDVTNLLLTNKRLHIFDKSLPIYTAFVNAEYDDNGNRIDNGNSDIDSLDSFEYAIKVDFKIIMRTMGYEVPELEEEEDEPND